MFVHYGNTLPTFHSEVDLPRGHAPFVAGDALVPASLTGAHGGQLQRQVVQDVDLWTQAGVTASSQPGEVESNGADDATAEDGSRARRGRHVALDGDSWRGLWGTVVVGGGGQQGRRERHKKTYQTCVYHYTDGASSSKTLYTSHINTHTHTLSACLHLFAFCAQPTTPQSSSARFLFSATCRYGNDGSRQKRELRGRILL